MPSRLIKTAWTFLKCATAKIYSYSNSEHFVFGRKIRCCHWHDKKVAKQRHSTTLDNRSWVKKPKKKVFGLSFFLFSVTRLLANVMLSQKGGKATTPCTVTSVHVSMLNTYPRRQSRQRGWKMQSAFWVSFWLTEEEAHFTIVAGAVDEIIELSFTTMKA